MFELFKRSIRGAAAVDERTGIAEARYVVIDTELTGLNEKNDSILIRSGARKRGKN
jgi:DNA polymerase III epsilon subunit-like protein